MEYEQMIRPCGCRAFKVMQDEESGRLTYYPLPCHCKPEDKCKTEEQ